MNTANYIHKVGRVVELVDTPVLGTGFERSEGSNPFSPTKSNYWVNLVAQGVALWVICCIAVKRKYVIKDLLNKDWS
jgi:hypothetical protein